MQSRPILFELSMLAVLKLEINSITFVQLLTYMQERLSHIRFRKNKAHNLLPQPLNKHTKNDDQVMG